MAKTPSSQRSKASKRSLPKVQIKLEPTYKTAYLPAVLKHEKDLIESERKYRELVELAHEGITTVDPEDVLTFVNPQFAVSLGYTVNEMIGKSLFSFATKESEVKIRQEMEIRKTGKKSRYEVVLVHKNGTHKYFWLSASPRFSDKNEFLGSTGVYSDMTEKKSMELKLERRVKQINALYRVYSHARMARGFSEVLYGITEDITSAFTHNEHVQSSILFDGKTYSYPRKLKRFVRKIEVPLIVSGFKRGVMQVGYNKVIHELSSVAALKDERELIQNVAKILCKHMHARDVMGRHKEIVTKAFTALVIVYEGRIQYANPRFYSLFKCKESEAMNKPIANFLPGCTTTRKNMDGRVRECSGVRHKGGQLEVAVTMIDIAYHGKPSVLVRINDITALKQAQAKLKGFNKELRVQVKEKTHHLERANARLHSLNVLKDEFIATTSHELRSPLTSIRGYLSLLVEDQAIQGLQEDHRDYLMRAYSTTDTLNTLVNNLLDVSRIDMGRFDLQIQQKDILHLSKGVVDSLVFQAQENKLDLEFRNKTGESLIILPIDAIRISQVIRNILDNSIKFTKQGKKIFVDVIKRKNYLRIEVVDQGVGIPKAKLDQIFEKFMQVKNTKTRYKGGVGLGLFITKRIVELHHGTISAEGNEFGGTTISIDLPLIGKPNGKK